MNKSDYIDPQWHIYAKVHDWKNYINHELQEIWGTFSEEQQKLIAENAQEIADREEWD